MGTLRNTKAANFEVLVADSAIAVDEWVKAQQAPRSELPKLNGRQRQFARHFGVTAEQYSRGELAEAYARERMRSRGQELGERVKEILAELGPEYGVLAVVAEMVKGRWVVKIHSPERVVGVLVPRELADDALDLGDMEEIEKLRVRVLSGLGRKELIAGRR